MGFPEVPYVGPSKRVIDWAVSKICASLEESRFQGAHYFFYGEPGTQKTTTALWIKNYFETLSPVRLLEAFGYRRKPKVVYITAQQLINDLVDSSRVYSSLRVEDSPVERYQDADLLIIDDLVKSRMTIYNSKYQIPFLDSFLRSRIELKNQSTILISTCLPSKFPKEIFGEDLYDLLVRNYESTGNVLEFRDRYWDYSIKKGIRDMIKEIEKELANE